MQPKSNKANMTDDIFFISPRMVIKKCLIENEGFMYADCFNIESKMTFT